jgi:DNA-binding LacI/PurR family transcriptional regulator
VVVRLKDVAERAGVSIKTVSNVVNGAPRVSAATRASVQRAIDELQYTPNLTARHLRAGRTTIVTFGVPSLRQPYFAELASAVMSAGKEAGLTVIVEETRGVPAVELTVASGLGSSLVGGVILSPLSLSRQQLARRTDEVPLVLLGEHAYGLDCDHVALDNVSAARQATEHLLGLGRTRVAVIGAQPKARTAKPRLEGATAALQAAGLPLPAEYRETTGPYTRQVGAESMRRLLALPDPPDAVFCFSDLLALGAIRAAHEAGARVPADIAVVGFDDIEEGRYSIPTLTTISPDKQQLARLAVSLLRDRMKPGDLPRQHVTASVGHRLVARESTLGDRAADLI